MNKLVDKKVNNFFRQNAIEPVDTCGKIFSPPSRCLCETLPK